VIAVGYWSETGGRNMFSIARFARRGCVTGAGVIGGDGFERDSQG
jgi:hypothetical protein